MDPRLMPPSHFDPGEEDSLEGTPSERNALGTTFGCSVPYLRQPEDFSPDKKPALDGAMPFLCIGRPQASTVEVNESKQGLYQTPPVVRRNGGHSVIPIIRDSSRATADEKHFELLRLRAENDTLKSMIRCKKGEREDAIQHHATAGQHNALQAVIEHQTQHIARLQREVEEQRALVMKRNAELMQYENTAAVKEKENRKLHGSVELLESQIDKRNEEEKMKDQEIEGLQKIVCNLRAEKDDLVKSHYEMQDSIRQSSNEEKEACVRDLTAKINELSNAHDQEKARWQEKTEQLENLHKKEIAELCDSHQKEEIAWRKRAEESNESLFQETKRVEKDLVDERNKIGDLSKSLSQAKIEKEKLNSTINELRIALKASEQTAEKHLAQLNQLQAYVGEQQEEDYERSQWKKHKQQYEDSITALHSEKETLNKTLELQNIRLQSVTKILTTQEEAVHANAKSFSSGNIKGNPAHVVMRRWREKVFELMVQCKSNEISMKNVEEKFRLAEFDAKERLEEERRVNVILESQLNECKAQLEMKQGENELLSTKNTQLCEKLNKAMTNATNLEEAVVIMSEQVAKSTGELYQCFHEKFSSVAEKTIHLQQRLVFANNRLRTLQDLFIRRDNLWKAKLKQANEQVADTTEAAPALRKDFPSQIERPDLVAEIGQLTKERDALSQKLCGDSMAFQTTTARFKERETELENKLTALQNDMQQKSENIADLKLQLDDAKEKLKDWERTVSDAKESVKIAEENKDKFVEEKLEEAWKVWDAEKRDLEKRLEISQREHARTVVTSRQSDRNAVREKKRAEENLEAVIKEHKDEMEELQSKLKSLKRDNNLLMTTLRQQGLISTFKSARAQAKENEHQLGVNATKTSPVKKRSKYSGKTSDKNASDDTCPQTSPTTSATNQSKSADSGNVAEMLQDLVVLTENILDDSE